MSDYYSEKLSSTLLKQCYDIAPPRVKRYLQSEVNYVMEHIQKADYVIELGCGYGRVLSDIIPTATKVIGIDTSIENLIIAIKAIRTSLVRTILTMLIISFGIMALVGTLTAIDAIQSSLTDQFSLMGANTITIESRSMQVQIGNQTYRRKNHTYISYHQAKEFKERFGFPAEVSIQCWASGNAVIKYRDYKSNPNVSVRGVDEGFLFTGGYEIAKGRNFNSTDIQNGEPIVLIGDAVATSVFNELEDPINKFIIIGNGRYRIIGVLKSRGTSMGMGSDKLCLLPYTNVRQFFSRPSMNYQISVRTFDPMLMEMAKSESEGMFRVVRRLDASDESDFNITSSRFNCKVPTDANCKLLTQ